MSLQAFLQLALQTVLAPRDVARLLISARLAREALLTAFALVVALNTLVFAGMAALMPPDPSVAIGNLSPLAFMLLLGGSVVTAAVVITWAGRAMGGTAQFEDIALLLIWLQALRFLMQVALILISLVLPGAGVLLVIAAAVAGLWILLNFIDAAHGFGSLGKSVFVLFISLLGAVVGLSILLSLVGTSTLGLSDYV
ncbi:Yip1 family protein [Primorskyibacter marinus]|uniref:Yip1 family protein n=1 Tax=Primorskyibacter marinus TaxID=1977320 RepID=UPI0013007D99|nr:Yip1 family protein [Primorskyibacter marinus]